jgi:transketolase
MATATQAKVEELREVATKIRRLIVEVVYSVKAGHVGGPMSAADLLAALYFHEMRIDPSRPDWEERDRFVLSKGHSAIGQYAVLALRGYLPVEELYTFDLLGTRLHGHPDMKLCPGIEMSTGSLGQGLSPAVGMAMGAKLAGKGFRNYVLLGDGEVQEGQIWEAALVAQRYELDNLTAILDNNHLQQNGFWPADRASWPAQQRIPADHMADKWAAFGWAVREIDGHNMEQILDGLAWARSIKGQPQLLIANTVKGKGVSYMENRPEWHAKVPTDQELAIARAELPVDVPVVAGH